MRRRWIGWSIVACVAATAAYAGAARRSRTVASTAAVGESASAPAPAIAAPATLPRPEAAPRPAPEDKTAAKPAAAAEAKPAAKPDPDADLAKLSDDPHLARADRIGGSEVRGMVAFTFDDGPNQETTPHVMAALEKYDVPATFFIVTRRLVGRLAAKNREILGKLLAGGFQVASHSVSHTNLEHVSSKAIRREIDQSLRVLSKQAGRPIGLFRAPFGALDERGRAHLKKRGMTEVKWSIDPMDWRERDADALRRRTVATILHQEGGVVLMHDAKEITAKTLGLLLDDLEAANCQRLKWKQAPIVPVSLHYWIRDRGKPRPVPPEVKRRTLAYKRGLPGRCAARNRPVEEPPMVARAAAPASKPALAPATATAPARTAAAPAPARTAAALKRAPAKPRAPAPARKQVSAPIEVQHVRAGGPTAPPRAAASKRSKIDDKPRPPPHKKRKRAQP